MSERTVVSTKKPEGKKNKSGSLARQADLSQSMSSPVNRILYLQRTIGNQAVQRMVRSWALQAKLRIGQPRDVYEQEADQVADAVMQIPEPRVQRQVEPGEGEETLQTKPLLNQITPLVQVQRQEEPEEEEETLQAKPLAEQITPLVQRQDEPEEEEEEMLQAKSREDSTPEVSNDLESQINAIKGGGQPLAESERGFFEPRFGYDFSPVRMHTDGHAAEAAQAVNARAFMVGQDVVFGAGQYVPGTSEGRRLMAHELTHVVQQSKNNSNNNIHQTLINQQTLSNDHILCDPVTPDSNPQFVCGPDVTDEVKQAVANLKKDYSALSQSKQEDVCSALTGAISGLTAWDIIELHVNAWIHKNYRPECATKEGVPKYCGCSVQVGKECYYAGSPNYVIFGVMCKLCEISKSMMNIYIGLYKRNADNYKESVKWAEAGYDGWPSGGSPPAGDRANCKPVCPTPYKGAKFNVRWCPHIDPFGQCTNEDSR